MRTLTLFSPRAVGVHAEIAHVGNDLDQPGGSNVVELHPHLAIAEELLLASGGGAAVVDDRQRDRVARLASRPAARPIPGNGLAERRRGTSPATCPAAHAPSRPAGVMSTCRRSRRAARGRDWHGRHVIDQRGDSRRSTPPRECSCLNAARRQRTSNRQGGRRGASPISARRPAGTRVPRPSPTPTRDPQ